MIKQELDILKKAGFICAFDTKEEVIEAALLNCEQSLQESYDLIDDNFHFQEAKVLENINISLTILKLMKESY